MSGKTETQRHIRY